MKSSPATRLNYIFRVFPMNRERMRRRITGTDAESESRAVLDATQVCPAGRRRNDLVVVARNQHYHEVASNCFWREVYGFDYNVSHVSSH